MLKKLHDWSITGVASAHMAAVEPHYLRGDNACFTIFGDVGTGFQVSHRPKHFKPLKPLACVAVHALILLGSQVIFKSFIACLLYYPIPR